MLFKYNAVILFVCLIKNHMDCFCLVKQYEMNDLKSTVHLLSTKQPSRQS